jgi:hypothetical protein
MHPDVYKALHQAFSAVRRYEAEAVQLEAQAAELRQRGLDEQQRAYNLIAQITAQENA